MAREALSGGDKILSESYFQYADHFTRIQNEQENNRKSKYSDNSQINTKQEEIVENKIDIGEKDKKDPSKVLTEAN